MGPGFQNQGTSQQHIGQLEVFLHNSPLGDLSFPGDINKIPCLETVYRTQVQMATWARLFDDSGGQWLLAGPDGSIHVVDESGEFFDSFHVGKPVDGLTGFHHDGQGVLVLSSDGTVSAYNVSRPSP